MGEFSEPTLLQRVGRFGAYLVAWLLLSAPGIWFFVSMRNSLFDLSVLLKFNPWAVRGLDRLGIYLFGLFWFVVVLVLEGYLRTAIEKRRLWQRIKKVFILELIFAAVLLCIEWAIKSLP